MEFDEKQKTNENFAEKDISKQVDLLNKLILKIKVNNTEELIKEDKKSSIVKIQFINSIISSIINEKENSFYSKKYFANKIKTRNLIYLIKSFKKSKNRLKYKAQITKNKKAITINFIITCFCFYKKVILIKRETNDKKNIIFLYELLNNILYILGKLFLDEIIQINYFELIIKILLTFVVKNSLTSIEEEINKNNEIYNMLFFKCSILLIKNVFSEILLTKGNFSEKENELINNIIIFIRDNIINSFKEKKDINYKNKYIMCKYDCDTIKLLDLSKIISRTNSDIIKNNYLDLISDIYSFNFRYENLMRPLLKQFEINQVIELYHNHIYS